MTTQPLAPDEYAEVRRNVMPRWAGAIPVDLAHRLLATVDAERARADLWGKRSNDANRRAALAEARADQAEAERDAARNVIRTLIREAGDVSDAAEWGTWSDVEAAAIRAATGDQP